MNTLTGVAIFVAFVSTIAFLVLWQKYVNLHRDYKQAVADWHETMGTLEKALGSYRSFIDRMRPMATKIVTEMEEMVVGIIDRSRGQKAPPELILNGLRQAMNDHALEGRVELLLQEMEQELRRKTPPTGEEGLTTID